MKVLITGGAGFIGSHLADKLLNEGHRVLVIDNYATGSRDHLMPHPHLEVIEGTIANKELVEKAFDRFKPDTVVHAAAAYKDPSNWEEDTLTNILGTVHVVLAAKRLNIKRFVYFQTSLCYGLKPDLPPMNGSDSNSFPLEARKNEGAISENITPSFSEPGVRSSREKITSNMTTFIGGKSGLKPKEQPTTLNHIIDSRGSSYAISKTAGEQYIELSGLDFISFHLANAYGPRNFSGPLPIFFQRLTTGKPCFIIDTRRDFIYIDDLVSVVLKAVYGKGKKGYYPISTGSDHSIQELFDETIKALSITLDKPVEVRPRKPDDVYTILIDPTKTCQTFDWKANTPLRTGIKFAIEWYQKHGASQKSFEVM